MIAILNYGAGNVESVRHALGKIGADSRLTAERDEILSASGVILPGVGAFGEAMRQLKCRGLMDCLRRVRMKNTPFLGICIGEQLIFEKSEESPGIPGLKYLEGEVKKIQVGNSHAKVPHMGWNQLETRRDDPLFDGLPEKPWFYFVHSYFAQAQNPENVLARLSYGNSDMDIAVRDQNLWAVQFHPEKSGQAGLQLLSNFVKICQMEEDHAR
ncbi:MAG: imidazole glycerol phosphate synthase subunit HisH [Christensenellaceae bacterium]|jgi:glutamine amidotransferase|nr:imidazole glycerol phosphate synthase subunit HisH [Christensenellaceae bacterium]